MVHKIVFVFASLVIFFVLDQYWLYPVVAGNLPSPFSWVIGSAVAMVESYALYAEWAYLD
jgi:hypothetical protein